MENQIQVVESAALPVKAEEAKVDWRSKINPEKLSKFLEVLEGSKDYLPMEEVERIGLTRKERGVLLLHCPDMEYLLAGKYFGVLFNGESISKAWDRVAKTVLAMRANLAKPLPAPRVKVEATQTTTKDEKGEEKTTQKTVRVIIEEGEDAVRSLNKAAASQAALQEEQQRREDEYFRKLREQKEQGQA